MGLSVGLLGACPDCGTPPESVRGRLGSRYVWCWKCERALRPGEARKARLATAGADESDDTPRGQSVTSKENE